LPFFQDLLKTFLSAGLRGARRIIITITQKAAQSKIAKAFSATFGENTRRNPWPLTNAEKLETQKGIRKRRKTGQNPKRTPAVPLVVLMYNATPMMPLSPREVSQRRGFGSK
jgi:hypothetical protein